MKTGAEIRHDAKERVKQYRKDMRAKGYIGTTIFLSRQAQLFAPLNFRSLRWWLECWNTSFLF